MRRNNLLVQHVYDSCLDLTSQVIKYHPSFTNYNYTHRHTHTHTHTIQYIHLQHENNMIILRLLQEKKERHISSSFIWPKPIICRYIKHFKNDLCHHSQINIKTITHACAHTHTSLSSSKVIGIILLPETDTSTEL